ncbi:hypothetical protein ACFVVX_11055 [Kitasatospora sp. NPDC058170]|uniref:hypothetical protein n=1 Tax=Kitasatospora sp. NPDC058170 TaxID=3346364 RepID=UPI0036D860E3
MNETTTPAVPPPSAAPPLSPVRAPVRAPAGRVLPLWAERAALRCTGAALAAATAAIGVLDRGGPAAVAAAAALALWAATPPPAVAPRRRPTGLARLADRRTTALAAGSVLLAAFGDPPLWQAAGASVLLVGYLLLLDAFGPDRRATRAPHALAALAASALALPAAFAPTGAGEWSRPLALLGIAAAACGIGLALRPARPPAPGDPHDPHDSQGR